MARVTGPSRKQLDERGDEFAARVTRAIRTTLRSVAPTTRVVDDLGRIQTIWRSIVENSLAPHLRSAWDTAVAGVRVQLEAINEREREALVAAVFEIPKVSNPLAESFLADATNRLVAIGDVVWYTARGEMLTGMQLGEGVAELRERVVASAQVSQKRAEVIARTEVNSAMNNGAYEQMKALDIATVKEWIATNDSRTRESHEEVDGEEIDGDAKFMVGGFPMSHPHDLDGPPSETINCRCTLAWEIVDDDDEDEDDDDYVSDLVAAGDFDEAKHKRDGKGRFAKKAGGPGGKGKKLKVTHGIVHKKHEPGTIIAVSGSDDKRVVWDGNKYLMQEKQADGGWVTTSTAIKSKAYVEIGKFGDDWHESSDSAKDGTGSSEPVNSSTGPLKITQDLFSKKYNVNDVIIESDDNKHRVIWDGKHYRHQRWNGIIWTTEQLYTKDNVVEKVNGTGLTWHTPVTESAPKPEATPKKTAGVAKSGKAGSPLKITHGLVHSKYEPGDVIAENGVGDKRVVWDGAEYRLQRKTADGKWTTDKKVKKSKAYVEINAYDSDWRVPNTGDADDSTQSDEMSAPTAEAEQDDWVDQLMSDDSSIEIDNEPTPVSSYAGVQPKSMDDLTKLSSHKKGGIFKDKNGIQWNVQPAKSESYARNQFLAANLYNFAGVSVESTDIVAIDSDKIPGGATIGVKTLHAPGSVGVVDAMKTSVDTKQQINENFAIDAWLGNWDVVGLGYENLSVNKDGNARRTNIGGSLLYRANGAPKGAAFGDTVTEIDSLRNPHINPASAKVFASVTDDDIRAGVAKLEKLSPETIDFVITQSGFTGEEAAKLKKTLKARRQDLINKYGRNAPKPAPSTAPAPSTQPTATNALGGSTKTYTALQKSKVQGIFNKHNLKWYNKTDQLYDAAHEVSTTHPDLTMADALDIMDQSLKKKSGNPFRTKVEKWLKTKAGKQHALVKGGSASLGGTTPKVSPASSSSQATPVKQTAKYVDHGGALNPQLTRTTANILQQRMNEATPPPWTAAQKSALTKYTGGSYTTINKCARATAPCDPATKKTLNDINAAMKPSTDDIVVYRKTNPSSFGITSGADLQAMVGKTISDNGVISTSIKSTLWTGQLHLEIEAPKGSMIAWVQPISHHPGEDEMVVAPGTHYDIVEVTPPTYEGGPYRVKLRIIPGSDTRSRQEKESTALAQQIADLKKAKEDAALKAQAEVLKKEDEEKAKVSNAAKEKISALATAYSQGYTVIKEFNAGNSSSKTELLQLADGTRVVRKTGGQQTLSKKPDTRFEYLSGRVYNALGGTDVHTAQVDNETVITTFVEGKMGGIHLQNTFKSGNTNMENKKAHKEELARQVTLPGGKEIGLLDYLIANQDRHSLNWIVGPNNDRVFPIDQGNAVFIPPQFPDDKDKSVMRTNYVGSDFSDYWLGIKASWYVKSMKPKFTKAELATYRANLEAIKDEFAEGEETEWYNSMMSRLAEVESKVKK